MHEIVLISTARCELQGKINNVELRNNVGRNYLSGVRFTKVFRTELSHKYILVECSVIALCLPVVSKLSRYKLVCYK